MSTLDELNQNPNTPTSENDTTEAESLGRWLANARMGYRAEQAEVARHLGLNPVIIAALEADDFAKLGPPVFARGYLSRYARLLELSEQEALARYQRQLGASQPPPPLKVVHRRQQTRIRDLRGLVYLLILGAITWTAIQNLDNLHPGRLLAFWSDGPAKDSSPTANQSIAAHSQVHYPFQDNSTKAPTAAATSTTSSILKDSASTVTVSTVPASVNTPSAAPVSSSPQTPAEPLRQPAALADTSTAASTTSPSTESPTQGLIAVTTPTPAGITPTTSANPAAEAKLLLEFSNDCWVEVKDAQGNVLVNSLMKANSTSTISGTAPFKVTLGNAPATRIILDDRLVNTETYVPRRGTVSRFTLDRGQP